MLIKRHNKSAIFMHWFNAACWIFLLLSGFALLAGNMQPIGAWWSRLWTGVFGQAGLLHAHFIVGAIWVVVYLIYILFRSKGDVLPFLREIFRVHPVSDVIWCMKKGLWLVLGEKNMQKLGVSPEMPPQGFYNAGQKWVAILAVFSSLGLIATGIVLSLGLFGYLAFDGAASLLQIVLLIHFICAGVMAIFLPVHIYMAALAPGERPALKSMLTGMVPSDFVKHHNPLWFKELAENTDKRRG